MSADAQGASDGPSDRAGPSEDGEAGREPDTSGTPSEAPPESEKRPAAEAAPAAPVQEASRGTRRRKRKADRGRRMAALLEAARPTPADEGAQEKPAVTAPEAAPAERGGGGGNESQPLDHGAAEAASVMEAATGVEEGSEAATGMASATAAALDAESSRQETETTEDAVAAGPPGDGEVMPFSDEAMEGEFEAAGVEELDIEDAVEVTPEAVEDAKPLLPAPLPEAPANWYERVFDDDYLRVLTPPDADQFERELQFYIESLGVSPGSRILDVGCGSGAHAVELQARGFDMVGLDSSMPLLMRATEEAQRRGLGPSFVHGDMRALSLMDEFDGVLCTHGTFGYFDDPSNFGVLSTIHRSLRSGGRLLLGVPNRDYFVGDLPARVCWEAEGCMVLDEVDFDFLRGRLEVKRAIATEDGRQVEHRYSIRTYALHELAQLVEQAGFRVASVSGHVATRDTFLGPYSQSIWLVAQKP